MAVSIFKHVVFEFRINKDSPLVGMSGKEVQELIDRDYKGLKVKYIIV